MTSLSAKLDAFPAVVGVKLSELISALSFALDLTEGQPAGHCIRCCWIGMHIGLEIGLPEEQLWDLYYTLLLKDLGCSSNAARICELYLTNDLDFKHDFKKLDDSLPQVLLFVLKHAGLTASMAERFRCVMTSLRDGKKSARELIVTRCQRGAEIALLLRFSEGVAAGIYSLDEHFDGHGKSEGLAGTAIPVYSRIALMAQIIDVFHTADGIVAAMDEVQRRSGRWFDPQLVRAFERVAANSAFWHMLSAPEMVDAVLALEPKSQEVPVDDDYLDDIAIAFGQVVDSKSPFTSGHSSRVALYADFIAEELGMSFKRRRWLKRGALLHDIGKLGISNTLLDKKGKLTAEEWRAMKQHTIYTETVLARIGAFSELAQVAGAHHERLDGAGYPYGIKAEDISLETRIITIADIFDALTDKRPYREPIPVPRTLEMMAQTVGSAIDATCFDALKSVLARGAEEPEAI